MAEQAVHGGPKILTGEQGLNEEFPQQDPQERQRRVGGLTQPNQASSRMSQRDEEYNNEQLEAMGNTERGT
jgi:hypothetical protein